MADSVAKRLERAVGTDGRRGLPERRNRATQEVIREACRVDGGVGLRCIHLSEHCRSGARTTLHACCHSVGTASVANSIDDDSRQARDRASNGAWGPSVDRRIRALTRERGHDVRSSTSLRCVGRGTNRLQGGFRELGRSCSRTPLSERRSAPAPPVQPTRRT